MKINITVGFPESRWEDYKKIKIKALHDVPKAFLSDIDSSEGETKSFWVKRAKNVTFAEVDGKVVGIVGYFQEKKTKQKHIVNVIGVYVLPEYRGMKIGYQLLAKVLEEIKKIDGIKVIQLGVVETQKKAMELYKSLGFAEVGKLKYAVNVNGQYFDEYLMQMYL